MINIKKEWRFMDNKKPQQEIVYFDMDGVSADTNTTFFINSTITQEIPVTCGFGSVAYGTYNITCIGHFEVCSDADMKDCDFLELRATTIFEIPEYP